MIYLTESDIHAHIQIRLKDESQADFVEALNIIELQNISVIKSYLTSKYNTEQIFKENQPLKNGILTKILTHLVLYDLVRRNATRKVPTDYKDDYDWAIKQLERINSGALILDDLPQPTDENGNVLSDSIWGNNTNKNFYL